LTTDRTPAVQQDELPTMIRIGDLKRKTAKVPVFLPLDVLNGLCFETVRISRRTGKRLMELQTK
jgi:hypothetical protein